MHAGGKVMHREATFSILREELKDRLLYNQTNVLERLGVHSPKLEDVVKSCSKEDMQKLLSSLTEVVDDSKKHETAMYDPLKKLFNYIVEKLPETTKRVFELQATPGQGEEGPYVYGYPIRTPDFFNTSHKPRTKLLWRDEGAFGEVKKSEGPELGPKGSIPDIVLQTADYARLQLAASPFRIFSAALLIVGTTFCVAIVDRDGISFSPRNGIKEHLGLFIRVVACFSAKATPEQLGRDPTMELVSPGNVPDGYKAIAGKANVNIEIDTYPIFKVSLGGGDVGRWITIGEPISTSLTLFGRGTSIWRVAQLDLSGRSVIGGVIIMKTSWRYNGRVEESAVYQLAGPMKGLASFIEGRDVKFLFDDGKDLSTDVPQDKFPPPISVPMLRDGPNAELKPTSSVLHRLFLNSTGRPLWEYENDVDLLKGIRSALLGHKYLYEKKGILHRDVSPGNILLSGDAETPGILIDLDLAANTSGEPFSMIESVHHMRAKVPEPKKNQSAVQTTVYPHTSSGMRGLPLSGTLHYMAYDLLKAIQDDNRGFVRRLTHDIESFIWVVPYCVAINLLKRVRKLKSDEKKRVSDEKRKEVKKSGKKEGNKKTDEGQHHDEMGGTKEQDSPLLLQLDDEEQKLLEFLNTCYGQGTVAGIKNQRASNLPYSNLLDYFDTYDARCSENLRWFFNEIDVLLSERPQFISSRRREESRQRLQTGSGRPRHVQSQPTFNYTYDTILNPLEEAIEIGAQRTK